MRPRPPEDRPDRYPRRPAGGHTGGQSGGHSRGNSGGYRSGPPRSGPRPQFGPGSGGRGPAGTGSPRFGSGHKPHGEKSPHRGKHLRPEIVFEDDHLLVLLKPPGLLSAAIEPGDTRSPSLFDFAKEHVKYNTKPGARAARGRGRVWIIHRLDRESSGILVFAKSEQAYEHLKDELRSRRMHRMYEALVVGTFDDPRSEKERADSALAGTIRSFVREGQYGRMECVPADRVRPGEIGEMKEAVTHYRVEASGRGLSLLRVRLETGRKHQIRVQLASIGHAVAGDRVYGGNDHPDPCGRLALHACELAFTHPVDGKPLRFRRDAPVAFRKALGLKGEDLASDQDGRKSNDGVQTQADQDDADSTSWDHVANWYDQLIDRRRSDHHDEVIIPGTLRLMQPAPGHRVLDIACGQGILARGLSERGAEVVGIDLSPRLLDSANRHMEGAPTRARFLEMDALDMGANLDRLGGEHSFDSAAMVMAAMNVDPIGPVFDAAQKLLKPGGRLVLVLLHPAFRAPEQSAWHWEEDETGQERCARLISGYLSPHRSSIIMNPGQVSRGRKAVTTWTFHRPMQVYINALAQAGFMVDCVEEWASRRRSDPGRRANEENRSRREIPLFLAMRARKPATTPHQSEG